MQTNTNQEFNCLTLFEHYGLTSLIRSAKSGDWQAIWEKVEDIQKNHSFTDTGEKNVFIDVFLSHCLTYISPRTNSGDFWPILEKWYRLRQPPERTSNLSSDEQAASIYTSLRLRDCLSDWLLTIKDEQINHLDEQYHNLMLTLWRQVFLNMFAPLHMLWDNTKLPDDKTKKAKFHNKGFAGLLAASMFYPLDAEEFSVDCEALFASSLPLHIKNIIVCWLINIPYFNGTMKHRGRLEEYVPKLCQAIVNRPEFNATYFISLVQEIMSNFWRVSYIGGNNLASLSAFGDLIHSTITRLCPNLPKPVLSERKPGERIRIGYISRNFFRQAVPLYMINRLIYHDRDKFEIFIFALTEREDEFTEIFKSNSDHFERFTDLKNFAAIINSVLCSKLDILIYTDIGMDVVTYILGGLRMAPIQCAMVGHGTTTGLPTIDYYISGDFEAPEADKQYREKLIRLPRLGAAQYLPEDPVVAITRKELGVPDEGVLFISCANGIKHRQEREQVYIEILKRAPNAYILLKPFTTKEGADYKMAKRIKALATEAGVADRLLVLTSVGHYRTVLGLLSISDVQLDTYPYGGWTTNLEALFVGLPIITQAGELSRSRWGAGMLRALGIEEGIAANDAEFVYWAVRYAQDKPLLQRTTNRIKAKAREVLFNGPAAQPAFEKALLEMIETKIQDGRSIPANTLCSSPIKTKPQTMLKQLGNIKVVLPQKIYAATSISPRDYPSQRAALTTWQEAGFSIIAINTEEEISSLRPEFPDIQFLSAPRNAGKLYQKPYIFFDDVLSTLGRTNARVSGIINSDIHLINPALHDFLARQQTASIFFGSRFEAASPEAREGKIYHLGFDYFFFHQETLSCFPKESFCLGLPWWDFWAALIPLKNNIAVKRLVTPVALHVSHPTGWDKETWLALGGTMAVHFPSPFPLSGDTMLNYLNYLAQRINQESKDVLL